MTEILPGNKNQSFAEPACLSALSLSQLQPNLSYYDPQT